MTHISFRITEQEKMDYAVLAVKMETTLTEIIKTYLNRLVKKHLPRSK